MVRPGLADTGSDSADPDFRHQLHRDARAGVYVLQIVDELGQILDRIDVMVGRRRDQPDARRRMADLGDVLVHLVTGKLAALARRSEEHTSDLKSLMRISHAVFCLKKK